VAQSIKDGLTWIVFEHLRTCSFSAYRAYAPAALPEADSRYRRRRGRTVHRD
jgi:hypothetical protein